MCSDGQVSQLETKSLPESEFKYEGASADAILTALEKKTKPKSNEIVAFTKLHSLKQGDRTGTIIGHQTGPESTLRYARLSGKCGKKGHFDSLCRSSGTPVHMLET